uniref:Uncharacterized protein n=1 Tax=Parascaris equorum TaxID=6256 RepID=A0A914R578_PAREQ
MVGADSSRSEKLVANKTRFHATICDELAAIDCGVVMRCEIALMTNVEVM